MLLRQHGPTSRHTSSVFPCSTYEPADSRPSTAPTSRHTTSECLYSLRYHLLSTDKFCVLATIRHCRRQTNALSLSDSRGLRLPWFIPSVLPSTCPHLLQFNEPTHVLVAPCSSSPSPGRCGFIRSSLPSPGQCGLSARHRHLRVGAASLAPSACRGVPPTAFARTHRHSDAFFFG